MKRGAALDAAPFLLAAVSVPGRIAGARAGANESRELGVHAHEERGLSGFSGSNGSLNCEPCLVAAAAGCSVKDSKDNYNDARDGEDCVDIRESATCALVACHFARDATANLILIDLREQGVFNALRCLLSGKTTA
ncbi:MAG TPA: hypothetical protein VL157_01210 [Gemmatimonadaceae bacterium]|jgi:hypothetical protein|nr:hypothetical protein [Gemmatimonadaceae bacterium]